MLFRAFERMSVPLQHITAQTGAQTDAETGETTDAYLRGSRESAQGVTDRQTNRETDRQTDNQYRMQDSRQADKLCTQLVCGTNPKTKARHHNRQQFQRMQAPVK